MNTERICYGCFSEKAPGMPCPHCGFNENDEQPYLALPLGTVLNGRYLIGKVLGIGGFGITYLGYDLTLEIKVAVKEYMPSALATRHPDHYSVALTGRVEDDYRYGMERFLDEAKILAKLQNTPNIVSVQNYFKENGTAYFVMEYIDGMSLKGYLAKNGGPIRSLADVESQQEAIVARLTAKSSEYQIQSAGAVQVGDANGYQICFETVSDEGNEGERILTAVEGYEFGCYFIYAVFDKGDETIRAQIEDSIQTFVSNGKPASTFKSYYTPKAGVQVIVDDAVAEGRVRDTTVNLGSGGAAAELVIYPTEEAMAAGFGSSSQDAGIVEVGNSGQMGLGSPEEVIQYMRNTTASVGASVSDNYNVTKGGINWLCVDMQMNHLSFKTSSAMIDGKCITVSCTYSSSNQMQVEELYDQSMSTVRIYSE